MPRLLSASAITTYKQCPYKYKLRYIDGIKVEIESPWLKRGSDIHKLLEEDKYTSDNPDYAGLLVNAMTCIMNLDDKYRIMGSPHENEVKLFGDICGKGFIGFVDRVWPDQRVGVDWKTGKFNLTYGKMDYLIQAYIYGELFNQSRRHSMKTFAFIFLQSGDIWEPSVDGYKFGSMEFNKLCERTISNCINLIDSKEFPRKKQVLCRWCDFKDVCNHVTKPPATLEDF